MANREGAVYACDGCQAIEIMNCFGPVVLDMDDLLLPERWSSAGRPDGEPQEVADILAGEWQFKMLYGGLVGVDMGGDEIEETRLLAAKWQS